MGVIRYGRDDDRRHPRLDDGRAATLRECPCPRFDIPFVATLDEALARPVRPDGAADRHRPDRRQAAGRLAGHDPRGASRAGLDVLSGLHQFLGDDPEFAAAAAARRRRGSIDYRRPPDRMETAVGRRHRPGKRVILTVGTDCAIGKMSVALELRRGGASRPARRRVIVPTGQTGMMIEGWGVAVDRVISDFINGTVEWLVEQGEERGDWVFVEGQGSIDHPAYCAVTLGLIHGATPHAMVLVHKPGLAEHDFDHLPEASFPIAELPAVHRAPRADRRARRAVEGRGRRAQHLALRRRRRGARGRSRDRRPRPACPPTTRSASAAERLWPAVRDARGRAAA